MSDAPKRRPKVISDPEIILLIALFAAVLYLLYPKTFLQKQLLAEKSNYDLTLVYLENLLPADPHNEALMLKLAEAAFNTNRIDLARRMGAALIASKNPKTQRRAYPLWYQIEKRYYFTTTDTALRARLKEELAGILEVMLSKGMIDLQDAPKWYAEALWLKDDALALKIASMILRRQPNDPLWLEQSYYLAAKTGEVKTAETLLRRLIKADHARESHWREALASLYIKEKRIVEAADLYLQAYQEGSETRYLFKALDLLLWNHRNKEAVRIARAYEKRILAGTGSAQKMLRFYLSMNALKDARRVALYLLKRCRKNACDFDLLYKTFLYASDPSLAYDVATMALRGKRSYTWQIRAAKSAMWSNKPQAAMDHFLQAYAMRPTASLRKKVLPMLIDAYRYESALKLAKEEARSHPYDRDAINTLVYLYNMVGDPEGAIDFLLRVYEKSHQPALLSQALQLALDMGDMSRADTIVSMLQSAGFEDFDTARRIAYYQFLQRHPEKAYAVLQRVLKKSREKAPADVLQMADDLAWYLGRYAEAAGYALALMKEEVARKVDLQRIVDVYRKDDPNVALQAAWKMYEMDRSSENFLGFAYLALDSGHYKELLRAMESIDEQGDNSLLKDARFWSIKAHLLMVLHRRKEASEALMMALRLSPNDAALQAEMLWMLVDSGDCVRLHAFVAKLEKDGLKLPEILWAPLMVAHMQMQEGDMAMDYFKKISKRGERSIDMKLTYAYLLQGRNEYDAFMRQMREIVQRLDQRASKDASRLHDPAFLQNYLQAAMHTMNPDRFESKLKSAEAYLSPQRYLQLRALWALHNGAYEEARVLVERLHDPEAWMQLTLALHFYDRDRMSDLLDHAFCALPIRDRVDAAERSGRIALAQSLAFSGLQKNRFDELLYYQNEQLERKWADEFRIDTSTDSRSSLQQMTTDMTNQNAIAEGWYLHEHLKTRLNSGWDETVYRDLPRLDSTAEVGIVHRDDRSELSLAAGLRNGVKTHLKAKGSIAYRIDDRWRAALALSWHDEALESDYLSIGGMKSGIELKGEYALLTSTTLQATMGYFRFQSQDGVSVGDGTTLRLESATTLRIGYPDLTVTLFGDYGTFDEKSGRKGALEKIMAVPGNVLPDDYLNVGTGLYWGYQNKATYVRPWRPFFGISPSIDLLSGDFNMELDAGIGGNLFNQDHWAVGAGVTPGVSNNVETVFRLYLQYRILY